MTGNRQTLRKEAEKIAVAHWVSKITDLPLWLSNQNPSKSRKHSEMFWAREFSLETAQWERNPYQLVT